MHRLEILCAIQRLHCCVNIDWLGLKDLLIDFCEERLLLLCHHLSLFYLHVMLNIV